MLSTLSITTDLGQSSVFWQAVLLTAVAAGMLLWILGPRVARPGCAVFGLVAGGLGARAISDQLGGQGAVMLWVIAGSVSGFLLAIVMFRVWVGISCALVLAMVVPAASLVWEGVALPTDPKSVLSESTQKQPVSTQQTWRERIEGVYDRQQQGVRSWWGRLTDGTRRTLTIAACGGALIGLIAGLIYPHKIATFESELAGSLLVLFGVRELVAIYAPGASGSLPENPRALLVLLGLITLLGCLVQWTVFKPKTDR